MVVCSWQVISWRQTFVVDASRVLCDIGIVSREPLFLECVYSRVLFDLVVQWLQLSHVPSQIITWKRWLIHVAFVNRPHAKVLVVVFANLVSMIWRERNSRTHGNIGQTIEHVFFRLKMDMIMRVMWCYSLNSYASALCTDGARTTVHYALIP